MGHIRDLKSGTMISLDLNVIVRMISPDIFLAFLTVKFICSYELPNLFPIWFL